jgi:hypothetical protein
MVLFAIGSLSSFAQDTIKKDYPNLCTITLDYGFLMNVKRLSNSTAKSLKECIEDFKAVVHDYDSNDVKSVKFEFMTPKVTACPREKYSACLQYKSKKADKVKMKIRELL